MTIAEQLREEGRKEGRILGLQLVLIDTLEIRFHRIPEGLREEIGGITDSQRLLELLRPAIQAASLDAFSASL